MRNELLFKGLLLDSQQPLGEGLAVEENSASEEEDIICGCSLDVNADVLSFSQDFIWHPAKKF